MFDLYWTVNALQNLFLLSSLISDCSRLANSTPILILKETMNTNGNVTFLCDAFSITRNGSLHWVVDGVTYNTTGTFNSSRGQLVVEHSPVDTINCRISSSLTVLNVQLNSQGVYTCNLQDNNVTLSRNTSLMVDVESSTEGITKCCVIYFSCM